LAQVRELIKYEPGVGHRLGIPGSLWPRLVVIRQPKRFGDRVFEAGPERTTIAALRPPPEASAGLALPADVVDQPA